VKNTRQLAVLVVLVVIAGLVWFRYFEGDKPTVTADAGVAAQNPPLLQVENSQLHKDQVERARKTEYKSTGRNIFSAVPLPPPAANKLTPKHEKSGPVELPPPPPPPPPQLPVKFFGYGTVPNGTARVAFFTDGEDVYVVGEGEVLLKRFRILRVGNASIEFEELSSGRHGTAMLEDQGAGPSA
jgi:hypothetical protein